MTKRETERVSGEVKNNTSLTFGGAGAAPSVEPLKPIRTYAARVEGFPEILYSARSPGKARALCFRDWCSGCGGDRANFSGFLRFSTVRRCEAPKGVGERILVCGKPATRVIRGSARMSRNLFMYDDGDAIMICHDSEITLPTDATAPIPSKGKDTP